MAYRLDRIVCDTVLQGLGFMTAGYPPELDTVPFYTTGRDLTVAQFLWASADSVISPWN